MPRSPPPCHEMVGFVVFYNKFVTYFMTKYVETNWNNVQIIVSLLR